MGMEEQASPDGDDIDFDFDEHRARAVEGYRSVRGIYEDLAVSVQSILQKSVEHSGVKVHSIEYRAKTEESFGEKAARPKDDDAGLPKYEDPLSEVHDLAGCRVITFFLDDVVKVRQLVEQEFEVFEKVDRSSYLRGLGRPGYESYHFVVGMHPRRLQLPEYARFVGRRVEIQVRTVLQHTWAEIEHDIQYKSVDALPERIGQRLTALAGMIEIADREFQAIADSHEKVRAAARASFDAGRLSEVELTAETLRQLADARLGPDGRMRDWSYSWVTGLLKAMGFSNLGEVDVAISPYRDIDIDRIVYGSRQGQLTRLELMVMAAIGGERYKANHPWFSRPDSDWFGPSVDRRIAVMERAGVPLATYRPGGLK